MAERGPPAPKPPTVHMSLQKLKQLTKLKQMNPPQQNPPLEPEVIVVPPNQVPDPVLLNPQDPPAPVPPVHILDPVPVPIALVHLPDPQQPQISPVHVPDPVQLQIPPAVCT